MNTKNDIRRSKKLSWLLRHGAREVGLPMDAAGWVSVPEVLRALSITRAQLEHAVATNRKRRLQLDGERVRACQGHSADGTPVTLDTAALTLHGGLDAMLVHPILVNRPIVCTPNGVRLCRPSETVFDLLDHLPPGPLYKEDSQMVIDATGARL